MEFISNMKAYQKIFMPADMKLMQVIHYIHELDVPTTVDEEDIWCCSSSQEVGEEKAFPPQFHQPNQHMWRSGTPRLLRLVAAALWASRRTNCF